MRQASQICKYVFNKAKSCDTIAHYRRVSPNYWPPVERIFMSMLLLLFLHLAAGIGAWVLLRIKAPAAALVGSMFGVVIFFVFTGLEIAYPPSLRLVAQVLSGLIIGMRFSRRDIQTLKTMGGPTLLLLALIVVINLSFSVFMFEATEFNYMTSLFTTGLGGVSDLALIATDFGADMERVALLQLFRLVTVVIIFPPLIKGMLKSKIAGLKAKGGHVPTQEKPRHTLVKYATTLAAAFVGGLAFNALKIPAGGILGSIVTTALWNILTTQGGAPASMKSVAQTMAGAYIGSNLTVATLLQIKVLFVPYLVLVVEIFVTAYLGAWLFTRIFKFDWPTALFCAAPGGIQVMGLIGEDLGLDPPKIVLLHTVRILGTLTIVPILAHLLG
ncbi:MAG: AbrB family transcriptional regulator [Sphaerochaeta sp.]|nr:AbrB family transcriptional regulator [Sphaerochaeta sp.]